MTTETETERGARYHHGDLKAALIAATLDLIAERRLEDVSVADAARAAGVSSGAPYRHFKDREALLAHVAAEGFNRLAAATQAAAAAHPPGSVEGIVASGCAYTEFGATHPELFHLMLGAARLPEEAELARSSSTACYTGFIDQLTAVMAARGLGHLDPHQFGAPLWAMVHGFASLMIARPHVFDSNLASVRQRIAEATHAFFDGIGRGEAGPDESRQGENRGEGSGS